MLPDSGTDATGCEAGLLMPVASPFGLRCGQAQTAAADGDCENPAL
jgi:hypothetical protein